MAEIQEVRVYPEFIDPLGDSTERRAGLYGHDVAVETNEVYYLEGISPVQAAYLGRQLLSDPNTQRVEVGGREDWDNRRRVEVAALPSVTHPEDGDVAYGASLLGTKPLAVSSATEYRFGPSVREETVRAVTGTLLVNNTIQQVRREKPTTLRIEGSPGPIEVIPIRDMSDAELLTLSKRRKLALNLREMQALQAEGRRLGRNMRDGEVEYTAGAAWSEHCGHKTTNADIIVGGQLKPSIFSRIKQCSVPYFEERGVLSAFHDNSGVFRFYGGQAINIKLETHNSPHMNDPEGGAGTGTGGVLRDVNKTGLGARPINSMHMSFTAPLNLSNNEVPPNTLTPVQLLTGSVRGVGGYGNPVGVPTNNGSYHAHPDYRGKASILVGSMGILPEHNAQKGEPRPGDLVIAVGARTGRDGLHGATFSSESANAETSTLHAGAVQIGDPIAEKKMFDAVLEASERGLIRAITDCGAAGFASAIGELGEDIGVTVDLQKAPLKYEGLAPWEIFLSESQERGVLAIDPAHLEEIQAVFAKHGSGATVLGTFGSEGEVPTLQVMYGDQTLVDLEYRFIKEGRFKELKEARWTPPASQEVEPLPYTVEEMFEAVLSDWNVCSKEPIVRQYDHEVQGMSALKPYGGVHADAPNNAAVMTPILGKPYALIQSHGCNPALTELDPTRGSVWSYAEAMANFVATGGNPDDAVIVNNYISATPTERVMGALDKSVDALAECVHEFRSPIISGKDSLSSTYVYPDGTVLESPYNLVITVAGKIPDVKNTLSTDIKKPGSTLVFLGKPDYEAMGGSVYYDKAAGQSAVVPEVDLKTFHQTCTTLYQAIQTGNVWAAHDVSEGGMAVTVSEMLFGGDCGAELAFADDGVSLENRMFNETAGGFVVEVPDEETAHSLFAGVPYQVIGKTTENKQLRIRQGNRVTAPLSVNELKQSWKQPMQEVFA